MTALKHQVQQQILDHTAQGLAFSKEFVLPYYDGLSILNIPPTIGSLLGVEGFMNPLLSPAILEALQGELRNVLLVLMDALSFQRFESWLEDDSSLVWHQLLEGGLLVPITSICPSTTCAAITSYWTDSPAQVHGIMGYEMWLKEYGITANMIEHKPITYRSPGGSLSLAGFEPESFLPVGSISDLFQASGVEAHAFQHYAIINSGLSRMFMGKVDRHPIRSAPDMWISIRELLESRPRSRKYIWAYWDRLDGTSHLHGPDSERARAEMEDFSLAFQRYFLETLDPALKKDTLVILTADHGQIATDRENDHYHLVNHPEFTAMLHILPSGENRLAYLHIKPGKVEEVKSYIEDTWPDQFTLIDPTAAVASGLFGPGEPHPEIYNRIGDLIAAARGDAFWWWAGIKNPIIGRHGGLSPLEMLVPFLAAYL
jgi:hypothetical protein